MILLYACLFIFNTNIFISDLKMPKTEKLYDLELKPSLASNGINLLNVTNGRFADKTALNDIRSSKSTRYYTKRSKRYTNGDDSRTHHQFVHSKSVAPTMSHLNIYSSTLSPGKIYSIAI